MKNIFSVILILLFIGVPCGTHAAKKDLTDNVTYNTPAKSFGAADDNDTELYDILSGNEPTLGPLIIGGTGDSWLQLLNNTSLVDDITGLYGIRFYNGVLQQIINGTPSSIGSGGSAVTTQAADPIVGDATGFYLSTGTTKFWYRDNGIGNYDFGTYAFTADPTIPTMTSATIPAAGTTASLLFSEAISIGAGGNGGWTLNSPTNVMTYVSGAPGTTLEYSLASTINITDVPTITYTQPGDGLESGTGGDLASIVAAAVVNDSTQGATCATSTVNATGSSDVGSDTLSLTTVAFGQSFQIDAGDISGITLDFVFIGTPGLCTVRWGTTSDLNTFVAEKTDTIASTGKHTFVFDTKGAASAATTYYFAVLEEPGIDLRLLRDVGGDVYPNGSFIDSGTGWALGSAQPLNNFKWEIELCD